MAPGTLDAARSDLASDIDFQSFEPSDDLSEAAALRARWVVPVRQPIVLISQVQRSGGHLLARLFDGHPECVAHPHELTWGRPKGAWPAFEVGSHPAADELFPLLSEGWQIEAAALGGLRPGGHGSSPDPSGLVPLLPFTFDLALQQSLFRALLASWRVRSRRDVLDAYLTASFNAWLDCRGLYATPKRCVTAFIPRVTMVPGSLDRFFEDYPDGHLITIVRHPGAWLASALRSPRLQREHGGDSHAAIRIWSTSTEASLAAAERFAPRVTIRFFDDLVHHTAAVMADVCHRLDLDVHPCLATPTVNRLPIQSNSLFEPVFGLDAAAAERQNSLRPEQQAAAEAARDLYEHARDRYALSLA